MYAGIPVLTLRAARMVAVLNLLLPGAGTVVLAREGHPHLWWKGALQFLTAVLLVGWLWALVTSAKALANARLAALGEREVPVADGPPLWR